MSLPSKLSVNFTLRRENCAVVRNSVTLSLGRVAVRYAIRMRLQCCSAVLVVRNMFSKSTKPPRSKTASSNLKEPDGRFLFVLCLLGWLRGRLSGRLPCHMCRSRQAR